MRVVVKLNLQENLPKFIYLDENEIWIQEADNKQLIDSNYKDRFNSLLSLFVMKNDWNVLKSNNPICEIMFEKEENVQVYKFDEVPDNFNMFMGYLSRLVGDSL